MGTLLLVSLSLPLLAAAMLVLFALARAPLRHIPAHEYEQAVRAPLWFVVLVAGGIGVALLYLAGSQLPAAEPLFIGWSRVSPTLQADLYTLIAGALLCGVVAAAAWVPAARRSLGDRGALPAGLLLLVLWCGLITLMHLHLATLTLAWVGMLVGAAASWLWLARPTRRVIEWIPVLLLLGSALVGGCGLRWMDVQGGHVRLLSDLWHGFLTAPPGAAGSALALVLVGWLLPAVALPWWLWSRADDAAIAWMPTALAAAVVGPLALVRLVCAAFPPLSTTQLALLGVENPFPTGALFLGVLAVGTVLLLFAAGWGVYLLWQRAAGQEALQPLAPALGGVLLVALSAGLLTMEAHGITAMLWLLLAWLASLTLWLGSGALLDALQPTQTPERAVLTVVAWIGLALLAGAPPGPVFWALWAGWDALGATTPRPLLVLAVLAVAGCTAALLPRYLRGRSAVRPFPGAGWGILSPFLVVLLLLVAGIFASRLLPLTLLIRHLLTQGF